MSVVRCKICGKEHHYETYYASTYPHILALRWLLRHVKENHPNEEEYIREIEKELNTLEEEFREEVQELLYLR